MNVDVGEQLALELGVDFAQVDESAPPRVPIDLILVVCQHCTGHHPTERCPERIVCDLCSGTHPSSYHLSASGSRS